MNELNMFLTGANTLGYGVAALLFFRARRRTGDPLFAAFSAAFLLLGIGQALGATVSNAEDKLPWVFLLRLLAFGLLIGAIAAKNLRAGGTGRQ